MKLNFGWSHNMRIKIKNRKQLCNLIFNCFFYFIKIRKIYKKLDLFAIVTVVSDKILIINCVYGYFVLKVAHDCTSGLERKLIENYNNGDGCQYRCQKKNVANNL